MMSKRRRHWDCKSVAQWVLLLSVPVVVVVDVVVPVGMVALMTDVFVRQDFADLVDPYASLVVVEKK